MKKRTRVMPYDGERPFHPELPKLGETLRTVRQSKKYTAIQLSKKLGYSQSYISGMENGHAQPCIPYLTAFAKFFNLNEKQLFLMAGMLPPQYQTYIAAYPEETYKFFEEGTRLNSIPANPNTIDYTRLKKS